jgi:hypothetical protein
MRRLRVQAITIVIVILSMSTLFATITRIKSRNLSASTWIDSVVIDTTGAHVCTCRVAFEAAVDSGSLGFMQLGPCTTLAGGHYTATFGMKRGTGVNTSLKHLINPACILSITSDGTTPSTIKFRAYQPLYISSFDSIHQWQPFKVGFYLEDSTDSIQFRIKYLDSVDVYADYVDLDDNPDTSKIVYAVNLQNLDIDPSISYPFDYQMNDCRILLGSIQGGLNRNKPQMVLLHSYGGYEAMGIYRWLYALDIPFTQVTYSYCRDSLLMKKKNCFAGHVYFEVDSFAHDTILYQPPFYQQFIF